MRDHARACIGGLAGRIVAAGWPLDAAVGRAPRRQIADDLRRLVL